MKLLKTLGLALAFAGITFAAKAQSSTEQAFHLSIGLNGGLPIGEIKTNYSYSLGGLLQADIPVYSVKKLFVTISAGYTSIVGAGTLTGETIAGPTLTSYTYTPANIELLPVKFGLKYFVSSRIFLQGEAGVTLLLDKSDVSETHSMAFAYAPQIGYRLPLASGSVIDAGFVYDAVTGFSENDTNKISLLQLRVSYGF